MSESLGNPSESMPSLTLADLHNLTATTADYQNTSDPDLVLRRGLVEEVIEYTYELGFSGLNRFDLEGELGDIEWYISEISRRESIAPEAITGGFTLDEFQSHKPQPFIPITNNEGSGVTLSDESHSVLAITALRVVDVLNPKDDTLWLGTTRADLATALHDLLATVSWIAVENNIILSAAIRHTLDKLATRERDTHVLTEAERDLLLSSGRERLALNPFVLKLFS